MTDPITAHIDAVVEIVHGALRRLAERSGAAPTSGEPDPALGRFLRRLEEVMGDGRPSRPRLPDLHLAQRYNLTPLELFVLWFSLVPYLVADGYDWIARANDNVLYDWLDAALLTRVLCRSRSEEHQLAAALAPDGSLCRWGLLSLKPRNVRSRNRLFHELVPHEQLPLFMRGQRALSPSVAPHAALLAPHDKLATLATPPSVDRLAEVLQVFYQAPPLHRFAARGEEGLNYPAGIACVLQGVEGSGRTTAVKKVAHRLGRRLLVVEGESLAQHPQEAADVLQAALFEAELHDEIVCVRDAHAILAEGGAAAALARTLQRRRVAMVLCVGAAQGVGLALKAVTLANLTLYKPHEKQPVAALWRSNLPKRSQEEVDFDYLAHRVTLSPLQIRKATHLSYLRSSAHPEQLGRATTREIEAAALSQVSRSIGSMATVSEPNLTMDDLVLKEDLEENIREIISATRYRLKVLETWGLGRRISRGTGIICLFDGEPGTGKTHSAEIIASSLRLSLVQINISSIVDKYIGETEKHLTRIFSEARPDISLLLFDEADSLFSKRTSDVSKSTDRYSNMNVNVLLQLIERYEGLTVLTTNLKKAIDPAFERRFTYKLHFKVPEQPERERLWRYLLPEDTPSSEAFDYLWLSEVELSGGEIKNAILLAGYRAAHKEVLLNNDLLFDAAIREASASGRVVRNHLMR